MTRKIKKSEKQTNDIVTYKQESEEVENIQGFDADIEDVLNAPIEEE